MAALPLLPGMAYGNAVRISAQGNYIAGTNSTDTAERHAVLWSLVNGLWSVEDLGSGGSPSGVAESGQVAGTRGNRAVLWSGGGYVALPGSDTEAHDISPSGNVVVGARWQPTTRDPSVLYPVPVVWKRDASGSWSITDLPALDGVDSEATGVGERNGQAIIVGYGFTKKVAIMRAVAWIPQADGTYGAPTRLAALGGRPKAPAAAADVNQHGHVVGTSAANGLELNAVVWTLP